MYLYSRTMYHIILFKLMCFVDLLPRKLDVCVKKYIYTKRA